MSDEPTTEKTEPLAPPVRSPGTRLFLGFLVGIGGFYLLILAYQVLVPAELRATETPAFIERCRQICESYGLVPTGRIDDDAREFLEAIDQKKLVGDLSTVLADDSHQVVATDEHSLLQQPAPDFSLLDPYRSRKTLKELNEDGPVIVVFYYGYFCNHCVAQLFGLNDDLKLFQKSGATVVAISADAPEETAKKYAKYGEFEFTVLSDPDNTVAESYGVFARSEDGINDDLKHGTFVIDSSGKVIWAKSGYTPFTDNKSLLKIVAANVSAATSAAK